jgi:hypothetical protein
MNKKVIGIFVCMLLITTALSATGATNIQTLRNVWKNNDFEPYPNSPTDSPGNIAIKIEGEVTIVNDQYNLLSGAIQVNDIITGKYIYDSATPDSDPDPQIGEYVYTLSPYGIELKAGGFEFKTNPNAVDFMIGILDNYYYFGDVYAVISDNNLPLSNGILVNEIIWWLSDSTSNALSSDALPTTPPVLSDWTENDLIIIGQDPSNPYHMFVIQVTVTAATRSRSITRDIDLPMQPILNWLFERFPNLFPILRQLLNL